VKIFIPIKNDSQRVPNKNFRLFAGEPLYKHTLLKLKEHSVYIDTDSKDVLSEVDSDPRLGHVRAYQRQESLRGHRISVCDLIKNFIQRYNIESPLVQIHVTSPFLKVDTLERAFSHMQKHDSVVSCNIYNSRFWRKEEYGFCPLNHNPLKMEQTQDLPVIYEENSAFYIFDPKVIMMTGNRVGQNPYFYPIVDPENIDIDTERDWEKALGEIK
tara:strand:- start:3793 stop:4434 length:642 start_codon:yes stop_codon:yes gene_type:complete